MTHRDKNVIITLLVIALFTVLIAEITAVKARNDANRAQKALCAFVIYEDGSARIRIDDVDRFTCRANADK